MASVSGYVLIETGIGKARQVAERLSELAIQCPHGRITKVDVITGPYDLIAHVEGEDLDALGATITESVQNVGGVERTTTCLKISAKNRNNP